MFERLSNRVNKKSAFLALFFVVSLFTLTPQITHAQIGSGIESILWTLVNVLFGWMVWLGGMLLDTAINDFVIGFGDIYATKGLGFTIDGLWVVVRDIFNLTFIFGLVFIGLKMIFGSDNNTKKLLVSLILAALLVNFSLFITKFVVDFSNIAAVQLVSAFPIDPTTLKPSISGEFARLMGLSGFLNFGTSAGFDPAKTTGAGGLGYILGTMILYIITAFVFLGGALLLMIRFVVLNLYIVLSPLMFIGWVFPSAAKYTSEYWSGFLSRCFFAPAYILMLYFAQKVLSTFAVTAGGMSLSSIFSTSGPANFSTIVPPFVLTSIFLISALVVAQKMGATGASGVMAVGKQLTGRAKVAAGGVVFGGSARIAQKTVGQGAKRLSESEGLRNWASKSKLGRGALKTTRALGDSSFDARQVAGAGSMLGIGTGSKGGFETREKAKVASDKKFAESLGKVKVKNPDGSYIETGEFNSDGTPITVVDKRRNELVAAARKDANSEMSKSDADFNVESAKRNEADQVLKTRAAEIDLERKPYIDKIAALEEEIKQLPTDKFDPNYNPLKQKALEKEIEQNTNDAATIDSKYADEVAVLANNVKEADKILKEKKVKQDELLTAFKKDAESSLIYENQLNFIESRKKSAARFDVGLKRATMVGGTAGAVLGGPAGAVLGAGIGAIGGFISRAYSHTDQASVDELTKAYGPRGGAMISSEKKRERAEALLKVMEENKTASAATPAAATPAAPTPAHP